MALTDKELDEPNRVKAAKCPICNGNTLLCSIGALDSSVLRKFNNAEKKFNCKLTFITIREAREQEMCGNPNNCNL